MRSGGDDSAVQFSRPKGRRHDAARMVAMVVEWEMGGESQRIEVHVGEECLIWVTVRDLDGTEVSVSLPPDLGDSVTRMFKENTEIAAHILPREMVANGYVSDEPLCESCKGKVGK